MSSRNHLGFQGTPTAFRLQGTPRKAFRLQGTPRKAFRQIAACALVAVIAGCGGGQKSASESAASNAPAAGAPAAAPEPLPGNSTISGRIKFEGTAEKPRVI